MSEKEPLLVVSVAEGHLTGRLIKASGQFTAAIASEAQKKLAIQLGSTRGDKLDKYDHFNIPTIDDDQSDGLVPSDSAAWLQCRIENTHTISGYQVITGRVQAQGIWIEHPLSGGRILFSNWRRFDFGGRMNAKSENDQGLKPDDVAMRALDLIKNQNAMTLATTGGESTWAAPVYYVYDRCSLYFFPTPDRGIFRRD